MNEFMIRFDSAEDALDHMREVESAIRSEGEEISKIRKGFRSEFGGKARILQNLRTQIEKMSGLGDTARTFGTSLDSILSLYSNVERDILGNVEEIERTALRFTGPSSGDEVLPGEEQDATVDRIHEAGREDEKRGFAEGATLIALLTLGPRESDPGKTGPEAYRQPMPADEETEAEPPAPEDGTAETLPPAELGPGLENIEPAVPLIPAGPEEEAAVPASWEDFLTRLPEGLLEMLPETALEYLHELFEFLKNFPMPFGDVRYLRPEDLVDCGIWATFFTLITWYFYQKNHFPGEEPETADQETEMPDQEENPEDEENEKEELITEDQDQEETAEDSSNSIGEETEPAEGENSGEEEPGAEDAGDPESGSMDEAGTDDGTGGTKPSEESTSEMNPVDQTQGGWGKNPERNPEAASGQETDQPAAEDWGRNPEKAAQQAQKEAQAENVSALSEEPPAKADQALEKGTPAADTKAAAAKAAADQARASAAGKNAKTSGGHSGGGSGSGSHRGGGSGGGSSLPSDTSIGSGSSGTTDSTLSPGTDADEYLTSLTGDRNSGFGGLTDWARETMSDWGRKTAEQMAESAAAAGQAAGAAVTPAGLRTPIGRAARSVVSAAAIDAGIQMAMHGAGALSAVFGGGKGDPFAEIDDEDLI